MYVVASRGRAGVLTSQIWKPWKLPWKTYVPANARSELARFSEPVADGLVNSGGRGALATSLRFHAA